MRALALMAVLAWGTVALAQDERATAEAHYQQGLSRYDSGDYEEALAAFTAASRHLSTPNLLYALGRTHMRLDESRTEGAIDHRVRALAYFEQYLAAEDGESRSQEVSEWVEALSARVGQLYVDTNVEGAVILLRGVEVATSPMTSPLRISAGTAVLSARATGHDVATREVVIAGSETHRVRLELRPLVERRGSLRITSRLDDVEVRLDGQLAGTTPMGATLQTSPGQHVVEGTRPGYRPVRHEVAVGEGGQSTIDLDLEIDRNAPPSVMGVLEIETPHPRQLWVDDVEMPSEGSLRLPRGPHRVRVRVVEREEVDLRLHLDEHEVERPALRWVASARAERVATHRFFRRFGWGLVVGGVGAAIASLGARIWAENRFRNDPRQALGAMVDFCNENPSELDCVRDWDQEMAADDYNAAADELNLRRVMTTLGFAASAVLVGVGITFIVVAASKSDVDQDAQLSLRVRPNGLSFQGSF